MYSQKVHRFVILIAFAVVVASSLCLFVLAAKSTTVLDNQVTITDTAGKVTNSNGSVTVNTAFGLLSGKSNTITITNSSGSKAKISFDYEAKDYSALTIDGASASDRGKVERMLNASGTIKIVLTAPKATTGSIVFSNFECEIASDSSTITFVYDSGLGSVTVGGANVSSGDSKTLTADTGAELKATATAGNSFVAWMDKTSGTVVSVSATYTLKPTKAMTIEAVFSSGDAWFLVNDLYMYKGWSAAFGHQGATKVTLLNDATLPAGTYTVPSGVTLLIPFDDVHTLFTTSNDGTTASYKAPTAYRTLTLATNSKINVEGAISVSAKQHALQGYCGAVQGKFGAIDMQVGSEIVIKANANLYAYGYIGGGGSVEVKSSGTVYENFQIRDWRGGNATSDMNNNSYNVFPITQYYVQNVQVPMTFNQGAVEKCCARIYIGGAAGYGAGIYGSTFTFIGTDGMFYITSGSATKDYDETSDRMVFDVNGDMTLKDMTIVVPSGVGWDVTIMSSKYEMALASHITVNIHSGYTVSITQDIAMLPGAFINIECGANVVLAQGKELFLYDLDEWGADSTPYVFGGTGAGFLPARHTYVSPYDNYTDNNKNYVRTSKDLFDATVCVNGYVDCSAGAVYTTTGGANLYSTGEGKIKLNVGTKEKTYQATQDGSDVSYKSIAVTPVKLKNADGSYQATSSYNGTYHYSGSIWYTHRVDYYEGQSMSSDSVVLIPSLTQYSIGPFETIETPDYSHAQGLFGGTFVEHGDKWNAWEAKYQYNESEEDPYVHAYFCECNAELLIYSAVKDQSGTFSKGERNEATLEYRLNDYIWLNAICYLDCDPSLINKDLFSADNGCEVVVVGNIVYIVRKVVAKEIPDSLTVTISYDGFEAGPFTFDFKTYAGQFNQGDQYYELCQKMIAYGEAAKIYFGDGKDAYNNDANKKPAELVMADGQDDGSSKKNNATSGSKTITTNSAKVYFDEALRLSVFFTPTGIDQTKIVQIGLLASTSTTDTLTTTGNVTTYVIFNSLEDVEVNPGGAGNYPTGNPSAGTPITDYSVIPLLDKNGRWEVCFDLNTATYLKSFELRPYIILTDGTKNTVIYGNQVHYSLAAYVSRTYDKTTDKAFKNLVAAMWEYAVAADEAF